MKRILAAIAMLAVLGFGILALPTYAGTDGDTTPQIKAETTAGATTATVQPNSAFQFKIELDDDVGDTEGKGVAGVEFKIRFNLTNFCAPLDAEADVVPNPIWAVAIDSVNGTTNTVSVAYADLSDNPTPLDVLTVNCDVGNHPDGTVVLITIEENQAGQGIKVGSADSTPLAVNPVPLTVTVESEPQPPNNAPTANDQSVSVTKNTPRVITMTGSDPDGDGLTFAITDQPDHGDLGPVTSTGPTSAQVTYTPDADFVGSDSFMFSVDDGRGGSDTGTVNINVREPSVGAGATRSSTPSSTPSSTNLQ
jgi:hypothetical protein